MTKTSLFLRVPFGVILTKPTFVAECVWGDKIAEAILLHPITAHLVIELSWFGGVGGNLLTSLSFGPSFLSALPIWP